jgi:hypothetical protein
VTLTWQYPESVALLISRFFEIQQQIKLRIPELLHHFVIAALVKRTHQ